MMFDNLPSVLPMIQSGKLRALAVTSGKPAPLLPDVPPIARFLPGFEATPWFAFVGPANLPKDIVAKLHEHLVRAAKSDDIVKALQARGGEIVTSTPEELGALMKKESGKWASSSRRPTFRCSRRQRPSQVGSLMRNQAT